MTSRAVGIDCFSGIQQDLFVPLTVGSITRRGGRASLNAMESFPMASLGHFAWASWLDQLKKGKFGTAGACGCISCTSGGRNAQNALVVKIIQNIMLLCNDFINRQRHARILNHGGGQRACCSTHIQKKKSCWREMKHGICWNSGNSPGYLW